MNRITPLNDHVVLKLVENNKQIGNIIIPDLGNEKPIIAEVLAVSEGVYNWHLGNLKSHPIEVGDIVVLPKLGAQVVSIDGEEYYICQSQHLLAKLNKNE